MGAGRIIVGAGAALVTKAAYDSLTDRRSSDDPLATLIVGGIAAVICASCVAGELKALENALEKGSERKALKA